MCLKRWDEIKNRIKDGENLIGAEIGVERGKTFEQLVALDNVKRYYLIDQWHYDPDHEAVCKKNVGEEFHKKNFRRILDIAGRFPQKTYIIRSSSYSASKLFGNGVLDFVFIDANHSYQYVKADILNWRRKLKPGGLLCGHDYGDRRFPGVQKAVDEFIKTPIQFGAQCTWFTRVK